MNRRKDLPVGILMLVLALLVLWHVQSFPPAPGQPYSSALFPGLAAAGLGITALIVIVLSLRADDKDDTAAAQANPDQPADENTLRLVDERSPLARGIAIAATIAAIVFYIAANEWLGFLITGTIILAVLMGVFGVRPVWILPIALGTTLLIHSAFYKLLKVPLPWGLLQSYAW